MFGDKMLRLEVACPSALCNRATVTLTWQHLVFFGECSDFERHGRPKVGPKTS